MVVYISARKKLIHVMSLNTDQLSNRAPVVACAISATRNYLKLNMPGTLNPLLGNIHAETRKLRKRSAMRGAASRTDADHQPTNRLLMHSACPPTYLRHSRWLLGMHVRRLVLASRLSPRATPTRYSHSARCSAGAQTSRDLAPWRFFERRPPECDAPLTPSRHCRRAKTCTKDDLTANSRFSSSGH
jgi:hypothetical protein